MRFFGVRVVIVHIECRKSGRLLRRHYIVAVITTIFFDIPISILCIVSLL